MGQTLSASCHCGSIKFSVELLEGGFDTVRRCNCSFCRMRGAVVVSAPLSGITILEGKALLTEYRFNTHEALHYFCSVCGIYTFHQRRSDPDQYGVNVACLEHVSPFDFENVKVFDGVLHPKDGASLGIVGHLIYRAVGGPNTKKSAG